MTQDLGARVQQLIEGLTESGEEVGLQVAAYVDGELVVDAWAGVADTATGRPVDAETLFTSWSTTKGFAATCLHILADRGRVDYDAPVAVYWPEFAANGKAGVTVRHVLTHTSGVVQLPDGTTGAMITDWWAMCAGIAALSPLWPPGTKFGYQALTYGWIVGEIVRRVDGRSLAQFAQEELCRPLGIEFYLGIPDEVEDRVAPLIASAEHLAAVAQYSGIAQRAIPLPLIAVEFMNRPEVRRASIPGGGGIMNARALARHYAMLACHGALDGRRLLSAERVAEIRTQQVAAEDEVFGGMSRLALGYWLAGDPLDGGDLVMGRSGGAFGHGGMGGSMGFADPERRLGFGLTKNLMTNKADPTQMTSYLAAEAIRQHLDA